MATDLESYYNDPNLTKARGEAETAGTQAAAYQSASALLAQKLKDALNEKMDYNRDVIEQKNKAMSEYFQAPSSARAKYSDPGSANYIFNPFQQEKLVTAERAQAYQPYANLVDILRERQGSLADIINAGSGAFQASVGAQQSAAEIARQRYQDLLGEAQLRADARYKEASLAKSGSGDGDDFWDKLEAYMKAVNGEELSEPEVGAPTEPKPEISEQLVERVQQSPDINWRSPEGQWIYSQAHNDWVPSAALQPGNNVEL